MGFFRQEYCSGLPFPPSGNLPDSVMEPGSPALQADSLTLRHWGSPKHSASNLSSKASGSSPLPRCPYPDLAFSFLNPVFPPLIQKLQKEGGLFLFRCHLKESAAPLSHRV